MRQLWCFMALSILSIAAPAAPITAAWDLHPQAAQLTAIELEWWTSSAPARIPQSVAPDEITATQDVGGNVGDTVFARARACQSANCSPWTPDASALIRPDGVTRFRFIITGAVEIIPE